MKKNIFLACTLGMLASLSAEDKAYPTTEKPVCFTQIAPEALTDSYKKGQEAARLALREKWTSPTGVWSQETVARRKNLGKALDEFEKGLRGASVKTLDLKNKTRSDRSLQRNSIAIQRGLKSLS